MGAASKSVFDNHLIILQSVNIRAEYINYMTTQKDS